ncbi:MAG: sulfite exporter TauE/SafE family protein [Oricola sp.]|nr:sulfite exporter TauE/SafE family protein [Oricola sp.]
MAAIILVIFVAALLQGALGFGFALVAMPLLALMLGTQATAALVALCGCVLAALMLFHYRRDVHFGEAAGLILSAAAGVPLGIFILAHAPRGPLLVALGLLIAAFSLYSLLRPPAKELKDRRWGFVAGFLGGILGGAYNIPGPPVILYGAMRRWSPARFLGVTQAFFLPLAIMIGAGHALAGF